MSWIDIVRALEEERRARAERLIGELCGGGGAVLLFGSRARGDNTPLSDWDLAHLVKSGEYRVEAAAVGQIFVVPVDKLEEILSWSMVALDIFADGKLLCGDAQLYEEALEIFRRYIEEKGLVRTRLGWVPRGLVDA